MALSAAAPPETRIPAAQAWNSWDSVYPAEFVHLPSGVRLAIHSDRRIGCSRVTTLGPTLSETS